MFFGKPLMFAKLYYYSNYKRFKVKCQEENADEKRNKKRDKKRYKKREWNGKKSYK